MPKPNIDQITALVRAVLAIIGTVLTTHGVAVSNALWEQITGAVLMLVPIVWSMFVHSDTGKLNAVAAMPEVKEIVVAPAGPDTAAAAVAADRGQPKVVAQ